MWEKETEGPGWLATPFLRYTYPPGTLYGVMWAGGMGPSPRDEVGSLSSPPIHISPSLPFCYIYFRALYAQILKNFATWTFAMVEASLAKGSSDLRFLLTHHKVTADVQAKLYENSIDTVAKFAAFVSDAADLRDVLKTDLGIDPASSLSLRAQAASLMVAWETAKARAKTQAEAEATNEVREWAKPIPQTDYIAMRQAFATQFGDLEDKHIPAKEYIEKKLRELETGEFRAEPLTEVISRDEVDPDVLLPRWNASGTLSIAREVPALQLRLARSSYDSVSPCYTERPDYDQAEAPWTG